MPQQTVVFAEDFLASATNDVELGPLPSRPPQFLISKGEAVCRPTHRFTFRDKGRSEGHPDIRCTKHIS